MILFKLFFLLVNENKCENKSENFHEFGIYQLKTMPLEWENSIPFPVLILVPTCTEYLVPMIALLSRYILAQETWPSGEIKSLFKL